MFDSDAFHRNVWYLIGATRGGPLRASIMGELMERPLNPNQLAERLGVDYKTITHHLSVLKKHNWVTSGSEKYAELFYPAFTDEQNAIFREILAKIGKSIKKTKR
ncbi:MAG: winged helix-turn-helix domain-containing protein [Candidatus Diapherotrites archaeon]